MAGRITDFGQPNWHEDLVRFPRLVPVEGGLPMPSGQTVVVTPFSCRDGMESGQPDWSSRRDSVHGTTVSAFRRCRRQASITRAVRAALTPIVVEELPTSILSGDAFAAPVRDQLTHWQNRQNMPLKTSLWREDLRTM